MFFGAEEGSIILLIVESTNSGSLYQTRYKSEMVENTIEYITKFV